MTALVDLSDVVNRCTGGNSGTPQVPFFYISPRVAGAAAVATIVGYWTDLWQYEKHPNGAGAVPGATARNPTNATAGALAQASPGGGRQQWLLGGQITTTSIGTYMIYDRLADISGLNGTTTTAQTITGLSVTRYTGTAAAGNMACASIYTAVGTTATTATISYTNQAGTAGQTSPAFAFGATNRREAQRLIPIPLASGDTGVRSVENVDLVATTGTAGDFGITIIRPLLIVSVAVAGFGAIRDLIAGLPAVQEIMSGACISEAYYAGSTTAPEGFGCVSMIEA